MISLDLRAAFLAALLCAVSTLRAEGADAEPLDRFVLVAAERSAVRLEDLAAESVPWVSRQFADPFDGAVELSVLDRALGAEAARDTRRVLRPQWEGVLLGLFDDQEVTWSPSLVWYGPVVSIDRFASPL